MQTAGFIARYIFLWTNLVPIRETTVPCNYDTRYDKYFAVTARRRYWAEFLATFLDRRVQLKPRRPALIKEDFTPNTFLDVVTLITQNIFLAPHLASDQSIITGLIIAVQIIEVAHVMKINDLIWWSRRLRCAKCARQRSGTSITQFNHQLQCRAIRHFCEVQIFL